MIRFCLRKTHGAGAGAFGQIFVLVRFVAIKSFSIDKDDNKYGLLPRIFCSIDKMVPSTRAGQRWQEVRFVAANLYSIDKDRNKYDLLPCNCARLT